MGVVPLVVKLVPACIVLKAAKDNLPYQFQIIEIVLREVSGHRGHSKARINGLSPGYRVGAQGTSACILSSRAGLKLLKKSEEVSSIRVARDFPLMGPAGS